MEGAFLGGGGGSAIRYAENREWAHFSGLPKGKAREVLRHDRWVESMRTRPFLLSLLGSRSTALPPTSPHNAPEYLEAVLCKS